MKKTLLFSFVVFCLAIAGCSSSGTDDEDTGATVQMQVEMATDASLSVPPKSAVYDDDPTSDTNMGNDTLADATMDPTSYQVAFIKVELGTVPDATADDQELAENFTTGFTIYEQADVDDAELEDITSSATVSNQGNCTAGTYNAFRTQILFLQMTFDVDMGSGLTTYTFRDYTTDYSGGGDFGSAEISDGDIMVDIDETYHWIDGDTGGFVTSRPANPVQDPYFSGQYDPHATDPLYTQVGNVDVFQPVTVIDPAMEITDCGTGTYTVTASFNVSDTFFFDDCDGDGDFEPASDDAPGSPDCGGEIPFWNPGPPAISATYSGT